MVKNGGVNIHYWEKRMASKIPENLAKILKEIGETPQTSLWDCHGTWVINHKSLEKIAVRFGIKFDDPVIIESDQKNKCVVLTVRGRRNIISENGKMAEVTEWSFGEASPYNNKNGYPYAMAEKRAKDRVILKLIGMHGDTYSEDEADDFKNSKPKGVR